MTHEDPVDELLRQAFAADQMRIECPDVAASVMRRLRRRARLRMLILGSMGLACIVVLAVSDLSLTPDLTAWSHDLTQLLRGRSALPVSLALLALIALVAVEPELI